ncbi:MAG TPA: hypoxanthine phosphoribosyltransferase [Chloroflexi bacterium]|nr:hypoxanthine phosphoribosyltransferase [Anaerolineaceae bacterium]HHX08181.1 hypoxanthine phosphoribosyltransferase [Chloroflexota bacterium]
MVQDYTEYLEKIILTEKQIQDRIKELGAEISRDYQGKELLIICILRGGVMFTTDIVRQISVPLAIEFMAVSSYGSGVRKSEGEVRITLDLNSSITDKHVLILEDIIDSGNTLASVIDMLKTRNPASLFICTLLDKYERREVDVPIRYCGFKIKNEFVFGYGLDMDEYYRNLPFIGVVNPEKYVPPT